MVILIHKDSSISRPYKLGSKALGPQTKEEWPSPNYQSHTPTPQVAGPLQVCVLMQHTGKPTQRGSCKEYTCSRCNHLARSLHTVSTQTSASVYSTQKSNRWSAGEGTLTARLASLRLRWLSVKTFMREAHVNLPTPSSTTAVITRYCKCCWLPHRIVSVR